MRTLILFAALVLGGCVTEPEPDPAPLDAGALPLCADLGCPNAFCTSEGVCSCVVGDEPVSCRSM